MGHDVRARSEAELTATLDASLRSWDEIQEHDWSGLLLGNGSSIAVWPRFGYSSLFDEAQRLDLEHSLTEADLRLFDRMGTTNFEAVLSALQTAKIVGDALGTDTTEITARHQAIRLALVAAVKQVHVTWVDVPDATLCAIRDCMLKFDSVYTTNYDLLLYWAVMHGDPTPFPDYFWSQPFDVANTELWRKATKLLFLHGAIHLYHDSDGRTFKRLSGAENLLESFGEGTQEGHTPLFVAEGSSEEKLRSIRNSDYLTFAYKSFAEHNGDVVIFGSSLGQTDAHLVSAMQHWEGHTVAVAMRPGQDEAAVIERKARLKRELPKAALVFLDSSTFPLGALDLQVEEA